MPKDEDETFRKLSQRPFEEVMDSLGNVIPYHVDKINEINKFDLPMCDKFKELGWTAEEVNNELNQRYELPVPYKGLSEVFFNWITKVWYGRKNL